MTRPLWIVAGTCAAVLLVTTVGFDALGGDCGDAIQSEGGEAFECNSTAYVLLAAGALASVGLLGIAAWAVLSGFLARRRDKGE